MPEIIVCPYCQRRLQLPADFQSEMVQCPSCQRAFPASDAPPAPASLTPIAAMSAAKGPVAQSSQDTARDALKPKRDDLDLSGQRHERPGGRRPLRMPSPKPANYGRQILATVVVTIVLLGVIVGVGWWVINDFKIAPPRPVAVPENQARLRDQVQAALGNPNPQVPAELAEELKPLFKGLDAAYRAADASRVLAHYDLDRMFDEVAATAGFPRFAPKDKRAFAQGASKSMTAAVKDQAQIMQWDAFEIRDVKKRQQNEAVVIVLHQHPNGATLKLRWWVIRRGGTWKVYDLEDLDMGMRISTTAAAAVAGGQAQAAAFIRALKAIREAMVAIVAQEDADAASKKMAEIAGVKLPNQLEGQRWLVLGLIHQMRGQNQETLDALDKALSFQPDMPMVSFVKGRAFNNLGKWDMALKHLEAYRKQLGDDALVCGQIGLALRGVKRFPEAAASYRKALDLNPKDADSFLGLLDSLDGDAKHDDVGTRFARLDKPQENFDVCAADCEERQISQLTESLAAAMRKIDANYASVDYYLSLARPTGKPEEAIALFKAALGKQPDAGKRQDYVQAFLKVMARSTKVVDAYAAVPDGRTAFRILAAELIKAYLPADLNALVGPMPRNTPMIRCCPCTRLMCW